MEKTQKDYKYFPSRYYEDTDRGYMLPALDFILQHHEFKRVLDLGCGDGLFGSYLKEKTGCELVGIDANARGLNKASARGYDQAILIEDLNTQPLPLQNERFDLIICKDILEHLLDPAILLKESFRILADSGFVLVHVPNHFPFYYRLKFLFSNDIDTQGYYPESEEWNFPHVRFYTFSGLTRLMKNSGFKIIYNLTENFAFVMPLFRSLPFGTEFSRFLARRYPDNFSIGFTFLMGKILR